MCCRYAVNEAVIARYPSIRCSGDVRPSDAAPAIVADGVTDLSWGFEREGKQLVINARSETAFEKPMFREAMELRRCALPAAWFYEWDARKRRNVFRPADGGILLLAGLYSEAGRFVILTTVADNVMRPVHDRMPLCLPEASLQNWLADAVAAREMLEMPGVALIREKPMEQGTLF
ncbi:MAG: SOS response-associated peptidase [Desulfovibrio sp.]|nr:SOS response-associated peptidase [Desulfovibrio sp.]